MKTLSDPIATISGAVVKGSGDGKKLGFPTANIELEQDLQIAYAVYLAAVQIGQQAFNGVAHYGPRFVFNEIKPQLEVYIFDFSEDIYGEIVKVTLYNKIRNSVKFDSLEAMTEQIKQDCKDAKLIIAQNA